MMNHIAVEREDMMAETNKCDNCGRVVKHVQSIKPLADMSICDECFKYVQGGVKSTLHVASIVVPLS